MLEFTESSGPKGDLAREILWDKDFPASKKFEKNFNYLYPLLPDIGLEAFKESWMEYSKELIEESYWDNYKSV